MRIAEDILSSNYDEIHIGQLFTDDDCNIIGYNKYVKDYIEARSKFKIEELPLKFALSEKLLEAMKTYTPCCDSYFVNFDYVVADELKMKAADNYYAYFAEYEPVVSRATGKVIHYFVMKDVTESMGQNIENYMYSQKFHDLMITLGVAHIDFMPDTMTIDVVGGRDNHNAIGLTLNSPIRSIIHPDDLQKAVGYFKRVARNQTKKHSTMLRVYSESLKDYRYFTFVLNPIRRPDGSFLKFSGFCIDVSDRLVEIKRHDDKLNIRMNKLEREKSDVEKSKSKMDQMLSVMGHDLRSPLSTILGFSELMVNIDSREEREEMYGYIQKSVGQMMVMVNDILESTRLDAGTIKYNISSCSVAGVVNDVYAAHQPMFKDKPIELLCQLDEDVEIETDRIRVLEILNNYMSNAVKYTHEGSVTLTCEIEPNGCYFHVIDTGVGIAKKDCEKAFERYEMLDSEVSGTGLGLYICRELAKGLGGKVGCISDKGKGCDFWLWLPR